MNHNGHFWLLLIFSIVISAAIAALYLFLFTTGYFLHEGTTVWIAVGISALMLCINIYQLPFQHNYNNADEEGHHRNKIITKLLISGLIGEIATIGNGMMALGGFLSKGAKSTLVLVYFCAMFFAFELIQLIAYAFHRLK